MNSTPTIAYFVSPHGYGHAARASAVMAALHRLEPELRFEIFTKVPDWFFADSLAGPFGYHELLTDIGLVQKNSLVEDLPATLARLEQFYPFAPARLKKLADQLTALNCRLVLCDIAPLGIAAAHQAGLPAVLIENFTWDWIYQGYADRQEALQPYIAYLAGLFAAADYHLQTEPICDPQPVDLQVGPISRNFRAPPEQIRRQIEAPPGAKMVVLTMGGEHWDYSALEQLAEHESIYFVIPSHDPEGSRQGNLIQLPRRSGIFHPDLVNAADAVIGKVGYSTIAEVYQAGVPFGYIPRPVFRESPVLVQYIEREMSGLPFSEAEFQGGGWLAKVPALLAQPKRTNGGSNGAVQAARFIRALLG